MHCVFKRNFLNTLKRPGISSLHDLKIQFCVFYSTAEDIKLNNKGLISSFNTKYNPKDIESEWYEKWEKQNYFKPTKSEEESFVMLLPPPNITGSLHLGHTLTTTIQDVILRWKRMKGESVLWIPGLDHAGISGQLALEKHLNMTLKLSRDKLKKEEFLEKIWDWKKIKEKAIVSQLKTMGASLDWSKLMFTMSPSHSDLVTNCFINLYNSGMVYRAERLINWSCALKSSISDMEVNWLDITGKTKIKVPCYENDVVFGILYNVAYKVCDEDTEVIVSTTRPETILGDVAVAVHPNDSRYTNFQGKWVWNPFRKEKIPILFDEFVDPNTGTGAVKITPSHSQEDLNVAIKHNLKIIKVINEEGLLHPVGYNEKFHGLKRFDAREAVIDELKSLNLFRGYEEHSSRLPFCSKTGDVLEFILKEQWFLKCKSLAEKASEAVRDGKLKIQPENHEIIWYDWMKNIKDWNLSRQCWWGHQIPMYNIQGTDTATWIPAKSLAEATEKASKLLKIPQENVEVKQDQDVLDTWFSSALLPLSIYSNNDSPRVPISLLVTGHDILFFWVGRMVMLTQYFTGKLPFEHVFLHGLVCDSNGKKMSKSVGNVIEPENIINGVSLAQMKDELKKNVEDGYLPKEHFNEVWKARRKMFPNGIPACGMDALRFTLCSTKFKKSLLNFDMEFCAANYRFGNKILQSTRLFLLKIDTFNSMYCSSGNTSLRYVKYEEDEINIFEKWILSRLAYLVETVNSNISSFKFYHATAALKQFIVSEFCNVYLECVKLMLDNAPMPIQEKILSLFYQCFDTTLRLLSPFMPFLSEHLYQALPVFEGFEKFESVTKAKFPNTEDWKEYRNEELDNKFMLLSQIFNNLREIRNFYRVNRNSQVFLRYPDTLSDFFCTKEKNFGTKLTGFESISRVEDFNKPNIIKRDINESCTVYVSHDFTRDIIEKNFKNYLGSETEVLKSLEALHDQSFLEKESLTSYEQTKRINNLQEKLNKIKEIKQVLEGCAV